MNTIGDLDGEALILVPRKFVAAACHALQRGLPAPRTLAYLEHAALHSPDTGKSLREIKAAIMNGARVEVGTIMDTLWMPGGSAETVVDRIDSDLAAVRKSP